eukprot:CAMPEP_0115386684 /NCGR_PEP_ID=MMETSP0271-20121206/8271_1 /TAXON_ID=71861 /ORGANISM="Scrippsiella trochoidea, Strain CCMP3099" /LENGTH=30 /DNA_ID= /DNA_START= /DNA_END= /DNA_ORIENTATION=
MAQMWDAETSAAQVLTSMQRSSKYGSCTSP